MNYAQNLQKKRNCISSAGREDYNRQPINMIRVELSSKNGISKGGADIEDYKQHSTASTYSTKMVISNPSSIVDNNRSETSEYKNRKSLSRMVQKRQEKEGGSL